jgi:hypothetical protein
MRILYSLLLCCLVQTTQAQFTATITVVGPTAFCQGYSTYLIANAGATTYQWYQNSNPINGATNDTLLATTGGSYTVLIDSAGNIDGSDPQSVTVYPIPNNVGLGSNPPPNPLCSGDSVWIGIVVIHPGDSFTYFRNSTIVSAGSSAGYWVKQSGTYYAVVTNGGGCSASTNSHTFTFQPAPSVPTIIQVGPTLTTTQVYNSWTWFLNSVIVGTGQYFYPTQNGDYWVAVGNTAPCFSYSNNYNVSYTGVEQVTEANDLAVYPNPNSGSFNLKASLSGDRLAIISITDVTGKLINTKELPVKNGQIDEQIDLNEDASTGLYFLKLSTENYNKVVSFVKQ